MPSLEKTIKIINEISPSFCAAKWLNATIWLGNGRTASCHLPLAHSIPLEEVLEDPSAIHNTKYKKERRQEMLDGVRCEECAYCWTVEDTKDTNVFSDRVYKSHIYEEADIRSLQDAAGNINPKTLEISFDNLCNLECSYCNAEFSTSWGSDIKENGPYKGMITSGGGTYRNAGDHALPFGIKNEDNPYITAFFEWFHSGLKDSLQELRVTGGEPTRSPWFWKLLDECNDTQFNFAVNSNLIMDQNKMSQLISASKKFKKFDLYTSGEGYGAHGEFVRSGLNYQRWRDNLIQFADHGNYKMIHVMLTISALSIWTLTEFMDDVLSLRKNYSGNQFHMSVNILRFPSFQNVNVLPPELKLAQADKIEKWLSTAQRLTGHETNQIERLITYLRNVERSQEDKDTQENKINDFITFTKQYSVRKQKDIQSIFPKEFTDWFNSYE